MPELCPVSFHISPFTMEARSRRETPATPLSVAGRRTREGQYENTRGRGPLMPVFVWGGPMLFLFCFVFSGKTSATSPPQSRGRKQVACQFTQGAADLSRAFFPVPQASPLQSFLL